MASTTAVVLVTTLPQAKTPCIEVVESLESVQIVPSSLTFNCATSRLIREFGACPIATITESASSTKSELGTGVNSQCPVARVSA